MEKAIPIELLRQTWNTYFVNSSHTAFANIIITIGNKCLFDKCDDGSRGAVHVYFGNIDDSDPCF